jgi:hypothetical protein
MSSNSFGGKEDSSSLQNPASAGSGLRDYPNPANGMNFTLGNFAEPTDDGEPTRYPSSMKVKYETMPVSFTESHNHHKEGTPIMLNIASGKELLEEAEEEQAISSSN